MLAILFVDDEPNILNGLQRMLRPMRHEWQLHFAANGADALALLANTKVDVIISDMQMPGMNGADLLQQVSEKYPHIVRIIFSGYSDQSLVMRSISVAHQYLPKPCDYEWLLITVSQACALHHLLRDTKLRQLVAQMKTIPSLPRLYNEVIKELQAPHPALRRISEIIQQDIGMTVKILQIINSAFFGLRRNISDISEAISLLGLETISALVLSVGIFSQLSDDTPQSLIDQLWQHSMAVGKRAKALALRIAPDLANDSFTAGLLHDIGKVVLAVNLPAEYAAIQKLMAEQLLTQTEAEQQVMGINHSALGAYLLELWGLPNSIVEAVAFFQTPSTLESYTFTPLTAVHLASQLESVAEDLVVAQPDQYLDIAYLKKLGLWERLPQLLHHSSQQQTSAA